MKKLTYSIATKSIAAALAFGSIWAGPAQAKAGDLLVRARAILVAPNEKTSGIGTAFPNDHVTVDNAITPEVDFTYMMSDNIGVELIAATTKHTVSGASGTPAAIGKLASTRVLPPTVTVQYHLAPEGAIRPYVGAGFNYTMFYDDKASSGLTSAIGSTRVNLKDSAGYALQAGVDIPVNDKMFVNFDIKYIDMDTTATLTNATVGVQKIKVHLDPIVAGVGVGMKF